MTTNHHTPLAFNGALTSAAMESPLGQLDSAIGQVMATGSGGFATALTAQANAASTGPFSVGSTSGMQVNDVVYFGDAGGTQESRIVATVPGGGTTFTVTVGLTNTYAIGKPVTKSPIEIVVARGASATLGARLTAIEAVDTSLDTRLDTAEADILALPQGYLGMGTATADQTGITTETDLTGLSVTVTPTANRRIRISVSVGLFATVATDRIICLLKESTTQLGAVGDWIPGETNGRTRQSAFIVITPTAAVHTYKVTLQRTGTGTCSSTATATSPATIMVEDLGAV